MPATATKSKRKAKRISHRNKPGDLNLQEWQAGLRRQAGREQPMRVRNLGADPVFSEFAITNPATDRTYRVSIRGALSGMNYCTCPDYAVNTLGTCKHVEAILHRLERRHGTVLRAGFHPPFSEVFVRYGSRRTILFSPGTECSAALQREARRYFETDGTIKANAHARLDDLVRRASHAGHELRIYDDARAMIAELCDQEIRRKLLARRYAGKRGIAALNRLLKAPLFPYQRRGALFAAQAGRAIIADDMGLGKTIQAIAAAELLARTGGVERVLIICPASLKSQWKAEIKRFSKRDALVIEGQTHQRKSLYCRQEAFFKIVNYDVIHRDVEAVAEWAPDLIILDEAQRIKNWETRAAKSVKSLESRYAIVLTGTPLENRIEELHSIVEFVDRHRLGPLFAFKAAHQILQDESTKVIGYRDLGKVKKTLSPILLRRTKDEVLKQLPRRMDKNFFVPMTDQQWVPHQENREDVAKMVSKWRRYGFLTQSDQLRLRIALQNMRMSCDSTYLLDKITRYGNKVDELARLLEEIFEEPGAKAVIFSQWVRMNELVAEMLESRGWGHVQLHGGIPSRQRAALTEALRNDDTCRVFLSTDAGGTGLNLQAASTAINMDLPWNPAVLEQRIGRVHRLGQKRPVRVVNFISEGTIEHGMLSLLAFKRSMFAGVLDGATDEVLMGDSALNRFMKTVETASSNVPPVQRTSEEGGNGRTNEGPHPHVNGAPKDPARHDAPDIRAAAGDIAPALGELLAKGAGALQVLGQALAASSTGSNGKRRPTAGPRVETDAATGQSELRVPLPDPQTLGRWLDQLTTALGTPSGK